MKLKFLLLAFYILLINNSFCQTYPPPGLYKGSISKFTGYFYFKEDSSFLFCAFDLKKHNGAWVFSDTISNVGKGKWQISDNFFHLYFEKYEGELITNNKLTYLSASKKPFDSLILKIRCFNRFNKPLGFFSVIFNSINKGTNADKNGTLNLVTNLSYADSSISVMSLGYEQQTISLISGNNYHDIKLTLTKVPDRPFSFIENETKSYKIDKTIDFFEKNSFTRDDGDKTKLKKIIAKNIKLFPERKHALGQLLKELDK